MTHTLHRRGDRESLLEDFPILAHVAKGYNDENANERLRKISEIMMKHSDLNFGDGVVGDKYTTSIDNILAHLKVGTHTVFKDKESLTSCLKELKEADAGISVVVSGCFDVVHECCKEAGIRWHLTEYSLGVHGNTDLLPPEPYLEILTMCGHAMVAKNHVDHLIRQIKKGNISYEDAGRELAKPCLCGIFNPLRAAKILRKMAGNVD
ncbi:MAG: hypothetical protein JRI22_14765 [Deltaproteobacteria bacterium]|nr:hypothetical protein [Deltaproteobacteria bacterium]